MMDDSWGKGYVEPSELLAAQIVGEDIVTRLVASVPVTSCGSVDLCASPRLPPENLTHARPGSSSRRPPSPARPAGGGPACPSGAQPCGPAPPPWLPRHRPRVPLPPPLHRASAARELVDSRVARLAASQAKVPGLQFFILKVLAGLVLLVFPLMEIGKPDGAHNTQQLVARARRPAEGRSPRAGCPLRPCKRPAPPPAAAGCVATLTPAPACSPACADMAGAINGQAVLFAILVGVVALMLTVIDDLADPNHGLYSVVGAHR